MARKRTIWSRSRACALKGSGMTHRTPSSATPLVSRAHPGGYRRLNNSKGYFSGKSHSFKADLTNPIGSGSSFQASSFEGQWNATSKDLRTGVVFTDVTGPKEEVTVRPAEEQGEWESRALWLKVAKGIRESDFETAAREKSRIEVCNFLTVHISLRLLTRSMTHFLYAFGK